MSSACAVAVSASRARRAASMTSRLRGRAGAVGGRRQVVSAMRQARRLARRLQRVVGAQHGLEADAQLGLRLAQSGVEVRAGVGERGVALARDRRRACRRRRSATSARAAPASRSSAAAASAGAGRTAVRSPPGKACSSPRRRPRRSSTDFSRTSSSRRSVRVVRTRLHRLRHRRHRAQGHVVGRVDRPRRRQQDAQRLARPGERHQVGLQLDLDRRQVLLRAHLVDAVADAAGQAGVRELVVRLGGVARRLRRRDQPMLRHHEQVGARRRLRDLAPHVGGARLGDPLAAARAPGRGPGGRGHQRHRQQQVARQLVRRGDDRGR